MFSPTSLIAREGGCFRCALRLAGSLSLQSYTDISTEELSPHLTHTSDPCTLCFGILNPNNFLQDFVSKINQSGHEYNDYKFQVQLPISLYLRQEFIKAKFKLEGIPVTRVIDIKDAFKWVFSPILAKALDKRFNNDSDFFINITFSSDDADLEIKALENHIPNLKVKPSRKDRKEKKTSLSTGALNTWLGSISPERLLSLVPCINSHQAQVEVECSYSPIYLAGNYLKFSRKISQSPWLIDGEEEIDNLQDVISFHIKAAFDASSAILHASVIAILGSRRCRR